MIDFKKLQYFLAVAEELHVGRAAERLGIAQPPLSRQIQALEKELATQLFHRGRSAISLTQAGEKFQSRISKIFEELDDAQVEARRISQGAEGRLRIGFVGSATYGVLPNILKSVRNHYPKVALSLFPQNNSGLRRALIQSEIDIAIARPSIKDPEIISKNIVTEPLIVAVPDTHPKAGLQKISFSDLEDDVMIFYPERPRPSFADDVLAFFSRSRVEPRQRMFAMDYQTAISLVSVEVGCSIVPASVGNTQRPGVRFVSLSEDFATTGLSVNYRIDNQAIQVKNFVDIALRVAKQTI